MVGERDGCENCRGTGYFGRTGIYELLVMDEPIRDEILRRPGSGALKRLAVEAGMRSLADDGLRLIREGRTTPEEILRVAPLTSSRSKSLPASGGHS